MTTDTIHKILKCSGIFFLSIIGLFFLLLLLTNIAIRPQNVQNLVERYSKEYLNAEVKTDTIEIHLLKNFPYASLSVKDCRIRSMAFDALDSISRSLVPIEADSLARIGRLNISVSLVDLFINKINIKGIELESARINAYVSQFGINNWDIVIPSDDTSTEDSTSFDININRIAIDNGANISFNSIPDSVFADFSLDKLLLKGEFSSNISENYVTQALISKLVLSAGHSNEIITDSTFDNSLTFSIDSLDVRKRHKSDKADVDIRMRTDMKFHGITMANNIPLNLNGRIELQELSNERLGINLDNLNLSIATLPIAMTGTMIVSDDSIEIPDLKGNIDNYNIKNILEYIPKEIINTDIIETDAAITLQAHVKGKYQFTTGALPTIDIALDIPSNTLSIYDEKTRKKGTFKNIEAAMKLHFDQNVPVNNTFNISKLSIDGHGLSINLRGKIDDYTRDPIIDVKLGSYINLDTLSSIIPLNMKVTARGSAESNISLKGRMSTLNLFSISKNDIDGEISSDSLKFEIPEEGIKFNCNKAYIHAGILKNRTDSLLTKGKQIFDICLKLDTLFLSYKDSLLVSGSKLSLSGSQEPPKHDNIIKSNTTSNNKVRKSPIPSDLKINGKFNLNGISIVTSDSSKIKLRGTTSSFSIIPWTDGRTPVIALNAGFRRFSMVQRDSRYYVGNSNLNLKIIAHSPKRRMNDTTAYLRDTTKFHRERKLNEIPDSIAQKQLKERRLLRTILKYWDINGNVKVSSGRIITPLFPLRTRISDFDIFVSNNKIFFQNTKLNIGNSSISLSGNLEGLAKAITEHKHLTFTGSILSDTLDLNQIMQVSSNSMDMQINDNRSDEVIEMEMEKVSMTDTSTMKAPLVPEIMDADINLNLKNVKFKKQTLTAVKGNLIAHNSIFQLNNFKVSTESGEIDLSAFYAAKKSDDISLGFDMKMKKFEVANLIEFIPNIDSLLPMVRSFRGEITCTISAMTKVDSLFNLKMETLNGFASIDGENVILMDGETFTEIAKALKFRSKDQNPIDRIAVQCVASDNKIEIFPFVMTMDRYKAAISGTQNLDLSFKYHISVLKSPIPFRIGLNISGTTDDMKFRIGKCIYKDENVPVYSQVIDSARINLGQQIKNIFRSGVDKAMTNGNTERLAKVAEEELKKANSMEELSKSERQVLDSTKVEKNSSSLHF